MILSQSPFFCLCFEEEDVLVKERVAHREREGRASGVLERFYYVFFFFLNCADVENCGSFKSFGYIYIYIYIDNSHNAILIIK